MGFSVEFCSCHLLDVCSYGKHHSEAEFFNLQNGSGKIFPSIIFCVRKKNVKYLALDMACKLLRAGYMLPWKKTILN